MEQLRFVRIHGLQVRQELGQVKVGPFDKVAVVDVFLPFLDPLFGNEEILLIPIIFSLEVEVLVIEWIRP